MYVTMRLFRLSNGRFRNTCLSSCCNASQMEEIIRQYVHTDGSISKLCLDFDGVFVPLANEGEIRLAAALLAAHCGAPRTDRPPRPRVAASVEARRAGRLHRCDGCDSPRSQAYTTPRQNWDNAAESDASDDNRVEDNGGESDSSDEMENTRKLGFDFEQNADIDATPNFGKTGIKLW